MGIHIHQPLLSFQTTEIQSSPFGSFILKRRQKRSDGKAKRLDGWLFSEPIRWFPFWHCHDVPPELRSAPSRSKCVRLPSPTSGFDCHLDATVHRPVVDIIWLWVKNRVTPKWVTLVNGNMETWTKTCGPIPGGLILTHTHLGGIDLCPPTTLEVPTLKTPGHLDASNPRGSNQRS